uniref:Histone acetyltransferase HAC1 isoform X1 n=1 Tax=Rhizophora mucronata TaxID=61149 RepID=A0A2P2MUM0_RHIMU
MLGQLIWNLSRDLARHMCLHIHLLLPSYKQVMLVQLQLFKWKTPSKPERKQQNTQHRSKALD